MLCFNIITKDGLLLLSPACHGTAQKLNDSTE